jgi:hypothetical protein
VTVTCPAQAAPLLGVFWESSSLPPLPVDSTRGCFEPSTLTAWRAPLVASHRPTLPPQPRAQTNLQDTTAAASASASSSLASPPPPVSARLTEQAVHPINAAFEAARGRGGGGGGAADEPDALTIATTNRYTYGLGPGQVRAHRRAGA